ncbi:MAG: tetratricopeptide repeat protein, partial [Ignavibacteria bacterium]|nr:tetratricopeptide repeat protein [Ignavibacteria bacterium]
MKFRILTCLFFILTGYASVSAQFNDLYNRLRLGQSYEQAGDLQKAKTIYEDLYRQQPDNFQFFDALVKVYTQLKNYTEAASMIEKRIQTTPQDINLYGLLGSTYYLKGDENKGNEVWDKALQVLPDKPMTYRVLANYAIERRAFDKAAEILRKGRAISADSYTFSFDLANLYSITMKFKDAAEEYCYILSKEPDQMNLVQTRIASYINKPDALALTVDVVEKWANEHTDNIDFNLLLGWLFMESNDYAKAYDIYLKIDKAHSNSGAEIFGFAQRALQEGHFEEASKAFKKIFESYPNSPFTPNAKIGYAKTLEASLDKKYNVKDTNWKPFGNVNQSNNSEYQEAVQAYKELLKSYQGMEVTNEANFRIGVIQMDRFNDLQAAESSFKQVVDNSFLSDFAEQSLVRLAEIEILKGNLQLAGDYYTRASDNPRASSSDKNFAEFMRGRIEFWNGNFALATQILATVEGNFEDNHTNDAIELSLLINTSKADSLSLLNFAKADMLTFKKQFKEASEHYMELSKNENLLTLHDLSAFRYAEMILAADNLPVAVELLSGISADAEKNIYADHALYLLGQIYQYGIKDNAKAVESYENLLAKFPNSLYLDDARE